MCNYRVIEFWCDKCLLATPQPESTTTPSSSPPNRGSWLGFLGSSPPPENSIPTVAPAEPQYHVIKQYTYQQCPQPKPADPPADQRYCENPVRQNNPHDFEPVVSRIRGMCPVCDAIEKAVKAAEKRAKEEVLVVRYDLT